MATLQFSCFSPDIKMIAITPSITSLGDNIQAGKEAQFLSFLKSGNKPFPKGPVSNVSSVPFTIVSKDHTLASSQTQEMNTLCVYSLNCEAGSSSQEVSGEGSNSGRHTPERVSHICLLKYVTFFFFFQNSIQMAFELHTEDLHEAFPNPDQVKVFSLDSYDSFVQSSLLDLSVLLCFVM